MRVEWAKARARADRWREEEELIQEEMRRVLQYLTWEAAWWRAQGSRRQAITVELSQGLQAYSEKQACLREALAQKFARQWAAVLGQHGITPTWKSVYVPVDDHTVAVSLKGKGRAVEIDDSDQSSDNDDSDSERESMLVD